jgi:hypothetical protein
MALALILGLLMPEKPLSPELIEVAEGRPRSLSTSAAG